MQPSPDDLARTARRLVTDLQPESVLDASSEPGALAEKLRDLDVDATGLDATESLAAPLERKYDLVVCIEVLEHTEPAEAEQAIESMCAATDRVLFSSSPFDWS